MLETVDREQQKCSGCGSEYGVAAARASRTATLAQAMSVVLRHGWLTAVWSDIATA